MCCDSTVLLFYPYTDKFAEASTTAAVYTATALTVTLLWRPLRQRSASAALLGGIWVAALCPNPEQMPALLRAGPNANLLVLQVSASLATLAGALEGIHGLGLLSAIFQLCLAGLGLYLRDSSHELVAAHLIECGLIYGLAGLRARSGAAGPGRTQSHGLQDIGIFVVVVVLAALACRWTFDGFIFNGDEVANTYQADVYGHFRAYGPVPACPSMFENYWVFRHEGRAFSQYTPGWPIFMATFQRLGVIWLAGPTMAGIVAVGVARLSRRLAWGLGGTTGETAAIVRLAGPLGAALAFLGPSMLLNGASRFSHTMVCACFAWAVECACVVSETKISHRRAWGYGLLLGAATAFGVATRPADGGMLGVGVFSYFVWALLRGRVGWRALAGTALTFLFVSGLTATILKLQLGAWFKTAYSISGSFHPEAELKLSPPAPHQIKLAIPLAVGSYCWWPAGLALGLAGHVQALGGRERRVVFMLVTSIVVLMGFYSFVEFGRFSYDGLGPRYVLPAVVMIAPGTAALLASPMRGFALGLRRGTRFRARLRSTSLALALVLCLGAGIYRIAPFIYPGARSESMGATAPLRGAAELGLKNAIVILEPGKVPADVTNLAQNAPFDEHPDVLFLSHRSAADEACARREFPGRTWYRAGRTESLPRY